MSENFVRSNLKPLKFSSFKDLQSKKKLDQNIIQSLEKRLRAADGQETCNKSIEDLIKKANECRIDGDDETAYLYYCRAIEIYSIMQDRLTVTFKNSESGKKFLVTISLLFDDFDQITDQLKLRYDMQNSIPSSALNPVKENLPPENGEFSDRYIEPKRVIKLIDEGKSILTLDYRIDQTDVINYKPKQGTGSISVAHIQPDQIVPGCLLKMLINSLDIRIRPLLERISAFDYVILIGDLAETARPTNGISKSSKTSLLIEALTTYNQYYHLRQKPLILSGGMKTWQLTYPCYILRENTASLYEDDVSFQKKIEQMLAETLKISNIAVTYPVLHVVSRRSEFVQPKGETIAGRLPSRPPRLSDAVSEIDATTNNRKVEQNGTVKDLREPKVPAEIESLSVNHKRMPPEPPRPQKVVLPPTVKPITPPPQQFQQPVLPPQRPSVPDRSTKRDVVKAADQQPDYFGQFYDIAHNWIAENSRPLKNTAGWTGLVNIGNTCFMNATLQSLFHTRGFSSLFTRKRAANFINKNNKLSTRGVIGGCYSALNDLAWSNEFACLRPSVFLDIFASRINSSFNDGKQHDAQEFLIYLMDALHEDTNRVETGRPFEQNYDANNLDMSAKDFSTRWNAYSSSPVGDFFSLTTVTTITCLMCKHTSVRFERHNQLGLALQSDRALNTLQGCLSHNFGLTNLDSEWNCPTCKCPRPGTRDTKIWTLPDILIIFLKRSSFANGTSSKNSAQVRYDIHRHTMAPYLHGQTPKRDATDYSLYAVVNHRGSSVNSGHYTAFVRNLAKVQSTEWLVFDDEKCSPLKSEPPSTSDTAYILFYTRIAQR